MHYTIFQTQEAPPAEQIPPAEPQEPEPLPQSQTEEVNANIEENKENGEQVMVRNFCKTQDNVLGFRMNLRESLVGVLTWMTRKKNKQIRRKTLKHQWRIKIPNLRVKNVDVVAHLQIGPNVDEVNHQLRKMNLL